MKVPCESVLKSLLVCTICCSWLDGISEADQGDSCFSYSFIYWLVILEGQQLQQQLHCTSIRLLGIKVDRKGKRSISPKTQLAKLIEAEGEVSGKGRKIQITVF